MEVKKIPTAVAKKRIKFRVDVSVGGLAALLLGGLYLSNGQDENKTGAESVAVTRDVIVPAAGAIASKTIGFIGGAFSEATDGGVDVELPTFGSGSEDLGSNQNQASGAILNLAGFDCTSGNYSLANGPWGALESAGFNGSISKVLADNPQIIAAAENGAQTVQINC